MMIYLMIFFQNLKFWSHCINSRLKLDLLPPFAETFFISFYFHAPAGSWQEKYKACGLSGGACTSRGSLWRLDQDDPELPWLWTWPLAADPNSWYTVAGIYFIGCRASAFPATSALLPARTDQAWNHMMVFFSDPQENHTWFAFVL